MLRILAIPIPLSAGIVPHHTQLLARDVFAFKDEPIKNVLMDGISEFDHDYVYLADQVGIFDQGDAQIGIVLATMVFSQTDNIGFVPGDQNPLDYCL
jgi:hypothetical protein